MAIFTPVQTTIMSGKPGPKLFSGSQQGPAASADNAFQHRVQEALEIVELAWGDVGRNSRVNLNLHRTWFSPDPPPAVRRN